MVKFYPAKLSLAVIFASLLMLVLSPPAQAQKRTVTGTVKAVDESSLPGVSVLEKGTQNGTVTDANGNFSLSVNEGGTLVFSFIGMQPVEVLVGSQSQLNVTMEDDITQLSEVVVVGYGTQKKSDLTGSIVSIKGDDLKAIPVSTVAETLTGRLAGVQVTTTEGSPDAEVRIRVRGGGSLTQDNSPLYIVDGFPVNSINDISPSDIQSIDVLKDASSTAIYGSRGANGVVIITTKSGKEGKISVSFNSFYGFKRIANTLDVLDPHDYVKWQYEHAVLDNGTDELESYERFFGRYEDIDLFAGQPGNNWQKQVYGRTGTVLNNDLSIRGGSEKFSYSVNYARFKERAIMVGSDFERNNLTLKLNNKPSEKIDLSFSLRYSDTEINGGGANEQNEVSSADSRLKYAITYAPIPMSGLTTADTDPQIANYLVNPLVGAADNNRLQERRNYNLGGSFGWEVVENLQLRTELGVDYYGYNDNRFYGLSTYYVDNVPASENQGAPAVILRDRKETRFRNTNTLSYDFSEMLGGDHNLKFLAGHEIIQYESNQLTNVVHGLPSLFTSDQAFKLTTQGTPLSTDNFYNPDDKLLSFFGRLNYDFLSKYLITATYRADASSKFSKANRWGYFPSVAAAWKISEENFMTGTSSWLNSLKLRVSYGLAGNNNIPGGQLVQAFVSNNTAWINGFDSFWGPAKVMANPDLKWESTQTRNIGLDFGLLKGRVNGSVEVYKNNTKDLLLEFPVAGTGYDFQFRNMGENENKGLETSLNFIAVDKDEVGLNFTFNIGFNRNTIKSLGLMDNFGRNTNWASTEIGDDFWIATGGSVGEMYGYRSDGRYEVADFAGYDAASETWTLREGVADNSAVTGTVMPGMMKLKDLTGDGIVNGEDRTIIGNANPKHTGGFILNGYAYGFDLTAAFNWSYGNSIYNANKIEYTSSTPRYQYRNFIDIMAEGNRWTNIDPATGSLVTDPATLTAMNANTTMWSPYLARYVFSDWAVEDGSFLRLNTLTLGYTVPASLVNRAKIQSLRFYVTGYNVFLLTDYTGFDPEVSTRRRTPLTPGVDYSAYPRSRQIVFGLNLNF
jgi:TonB-linked SusC/RagA family outer membrane protein